VYPSVNGALLLPPFLLAVHVVCAREKDGRLNDLCLLFYELNLYVGFLWGRALLIFVVPEPASSVIPTLVHTRGPGALKPGSRFKRTQVGPLCLPEILISEYALSWPPCTNKPPEPGAEPRPTEPGGHTGQAYCSEWLMPLCHRGRPDIRTSFAEIFYKIYIPKSFLWKAFQYLPRFRELVISAIKITNISVIYLHLLTYIPKHLWKILNWWKMT